MYNEALCSLLIIDRNNVFKSEQWIPDEVWKDWLKLLWWQATIICRSLRMEEEKEREHPWMPSIFAEWQWCVWAPSTSCLDDCYWMKDSLHCDASYCIEVEFLSLTSIVVICFTAKAGVEIFHMSEQWCRISFCYWVRETVYFTWWTGFR